jgi:phosphoesterase RecJ-like protein
MSELFNNLENKSILITGHINPDGDALGASLAFKIILNELGYKSDVCFDIKGTVPSNLNHLPLNLISETTKEQYDSIYVFDCGNPQRLGKLEPLSQTASEVVVIDHHIDPSFGDVQIIDPTAASTTQVLYREIKKHNYKISKDVANCLMTGLITDTGRFQYSNTDSEVFIIASELMKSGADLTKISENIYGSISFNAMKLQSEIIKRIKLFGDHSLVVSYVLQEDYKEYNIEESELDFLIDSIRLVKESNIALLLKEQQDNSFKGSLRSRNKIDVQLVASKFGGGGHKAASGFSSTQTMEIIIEEVKEAIELQL